MFVALVFLDSEIRLVCPECGGVDIWGDKIFATG